MLGGLLVRLNSSMNCAFQGQSCGRCRVSRLAEDATRVGTLIRVRRIVPVVARVNRLPARVPAARVRLNAMTAKVSQALFALNCPMGGGPGVRRSGRRTRSR